MPMMEGTWFYNSGQKGYSYTISRLDSGALAFHQKLPGGEDLYGEIEVTADSQRWEASLSNGAKMRFQLEEGALLTNYLRNGTTEWRSTLKAQRQSPIPQQESGNTMGRRGFSAGVPKLSTAAGPPQEVLAVQRSVLEVLGAAEELPVWDDPLKAGAASLQSSLWSRIVDLAAAPRESPAAASRARLRLPLAQYMSASRLDRVQDEEAAHQDKKRTIVPVTSVRLLPGAQHPLSFNEEQMLRLFVGDPRNTAYNLTDGLRCAFPLDAEQLVRSLLIVSERHDVLRSIYRMEGGNSGYRIVAREHPGALHVLLAPAFGDVQRIQAMRFHTAHQLGVACMRWNCEVAHNAQGAYGFDLHHIAGDGESMGMIHKEVLQAQACIWQGMSNDETRKLLPSLPVQYVDFAYWQRSLDSQGLFESELAYWSSGVTSTCPPVALNIPIDYPRPRLWTVIGDSLKCPLDVNLVTPLREVCVRATPFAVLVANWSITLSRLGGTMYVDMATPFGLRALPSLTNMIGDFVNMLSMRVKCDPEETYVSCLERVADSCINLQRYPFAPLLVLLNSLRKYYYGHDPSRNPIYQSMIDLFENPSEEPNRSMVGIMDIFLFANTRQGQLWAVDATYNSTILSAETVRTIMLQLLAITRHVAANATKPVPRSLPSREQGQEPPTNRGISLAQVFMQVGALPHAFVIQSGWDPDHLTPSLRYDIRNSYRLKRHSALQLWSASGLDGHNPRKSKELDRRKSLGQLAEAPSAAAVEGEARPRPVALSVADPNADHSAAGPIDGKQTKPNRSHAADASEYMYKGFCDNCQAWMVPGADWYHQPGTVADLCAKHWRPLNNIERAQYVNVRSFIELGSDMPNYQVARERPKEASDRAAERSAEVERCRSRAKKYLELAGSAQRSQRHDEILVLDRSENLLSGTGLAPMPGLRGDHRQPGRRRRV